MTTTEFVAHLDAHGLDPKANGPGRFMSRCPAHDDRQASLSIREVEADGRTLLNCFASCEPETIVGAVGLRLADLFADTLDHPPVPRPKPRLPALQGADRILNAILAYGTYRPAKRDGVWQATCPLCREDTLVVIEESGYDRLETRHPPAIATCMAGCDNASVKAALS